MNPAATQSAMKQQLQAPFRRLTLHEAIEAYDAFIKEELKWLKGTFRQGARGPLFRLEDFRVEPSQLVLEDACPCGLVYAPLPAAYKAAAFFWHVRGAEHLAWQCGWQTQAFLALFQRLAPLTQFQRAIVLALEEQDGNPRHCSD